MRGKHHYKVLLITQYDDSEYGERTEKVVFQTKKRAEAEHFIATHGYLENLDSDYCYVQLWLHKDY